VRLADRGLTPPDSWRDLPNRGVINRSPFVILVRKDNPKGIHDFSDLSVPGIGVIHPDPVTSGGANWALIAEYGAGARQHPGQPDAGYQMLLDIWGNIAGLGASARSARTQFENGFGDALVTYEQEALWDKARGKLKLDVVYPRSTVLSEHTLVMIDRNIAPNERAMVTEFVNFLWSEKAQQVFVKYGFRSVDDRLNTANSAFGKIQDPFLIDDFGGWPRAKREIIDNLWKNCAIKRIEYKNCRT